MLYTYYRRDPHYNNTFNAALYDNRYGLTGSTLKKRYTIKFDKEINHKLFITAFDRAIEKAYNVNYNVMYSKGDAEFKLE